VAKRRYELWAEAIRDVGILLMVFAPLDTLLRDQRAATPEWFLAGGFSVLGLLLIEVGVRMELRK
jgi:hypothetical protein